MDKQKMVENNFPLVDALLLEPKEGRNGHIGICTNTTASGQVFNEIEESLRKNVSVLGSLIVSRDGAERMILNSLAHPSMTHLIIFSEESLTFSPSTNLLQALMHGLDSSKGGNYIKDGVAASSQYPNLSEEILDAFRDSITVIPMFMYKSDYSKQIVTDYLSWLKPKVSKKLFTLLSEINDKKKIYYDSLNEVLRELGTVEKKGKRLVKLNAKDFQHLQPPRISLPDSKEVPEVPFRVQKEGRLIRVDLKTKKETLSIKSDDDFLLSYSLMRYLGKNKNDFSPLEQLLLGAEIGRVGTEISNKIIFPSFVKETPITGERQVPLESNIDLVMDQEYYYKLGIKDNEVGCMCMAFDLCEEVFELKAKSVGPLIKKLAELNRFEEYEMDILHRLDLGTQIGRAGIAAHLGYAFIQDFSTIFKINTEDLPFLVVDGDNFLDVHKGVLRSIYMNGITEEHSDVWKGPARTASVLALYRNTDNSLKELPKIYQQGEHTTKEMREAYKEQLLRFDHDGSYSYGERTRSFFGFDQLEKTVEILKKDPEKATVIQRYDPTTDMGTSKDPDTGKTIFTHDPCLTHDIFFIHNKKLYSFHIARAHNTVNAYPENIFGLYDAYVKTVQEKLGLSGGDMYMLSNRANILLLTEEQRTKKLLGEPSKPTDTNSNTWSGPYKLGKEYKSPKHTGGVAYSVTPLKKTTKRPTSEILNVLENQKGINTIERATNYLKIKGMSHNNPVLSSYSPGSSDPQGSELVFFQANVFGKKLHATAVFTNRDKNLLEEDTNLCNYIATQYQKKLGVNLGNLVLLYVAYK